MSTRRGQPPDDASSAPESGTVRDETTANVAARETTEEQNLPKPGGRPQQDDPAADEER